MHYVDREGIVISKSGWHELQADPEYRNLREFSNDKVRILLYWSGSLSGKEYHSWPELWPVFRLSVWNYNEQGVAQRDPVRDGDSFATEKEALAGYESILTEWTDCHYRHDGSFVEVDNDLAPPPPPDPNIPTSVPKGMASDFVAW